VIAALLRFIALAIPIAGAAIPAFAGQVTFDLMIHNGRLPESMRLIRVTQGDVVILRCTTDHPIVLHLHGYAVEQRITPGRTVELTFRAFATGRFPIHIHAEAAPAAEPEDASLADVEVWPR
jgi:hypothetical protein